MMEILGNVILQQMASDWTEGFQFGLSLMSIEEWEGITSLGYSNGWLILGEDRETFSSWGLLSFGKPKGKNPMFFLGQGKRSPDLLDA